MVTSSQNCSVNVPWQKRVFAWGMSGAAPIPATIVFIAARAEFTPPVLYSKENRSKLVYLVEAKPAPADAAKLHPGQPVDVTLPAS